MGDMTMSILKCRQVLLLTQNLSTRRHLFAQLVSDKPTGQSCCLENKSDKQMEIYSSHVEHNVPDLNTGDTEDHVITTGIQHLSLICLLMPITPYIKRRYG